MEERNKCKRGKITASWFSFPQYTWQISIEEPGSHRSREICYKNLNGETGKWTKKGNNKLNDADSLLHNTTSHTQHLYQISKSSI